MTRLGPVGHERIRPGRLQWQRVLAREGEVHLSIGLHSCHPPYPKPRATGRAPAQAGAAASWGSSCALDEPGSFAMTTLLGSRTRLVSE